jgi:hypothetical protein
MKAVNNISNWQTLDPKAFGADHQQIIGALLKLFHKSKHLMIFIERSAKILRIKAFRLI